MIKEFAASGAYPADRQDRDGALLVLDRQTRRLFPCLETIFADGAYGGEKLRRAMADAAWRIELVKIARLRVDRSAGVRRARLPAL